MKHSYLKIIPITAKYCSSSIKLHQLLFISFCGVSCNIGFFNYAVFDLMEQQRMESTKSRL